MTVEKTAFLVRTHERSLQVQRLVDSLKNSMSNNVFVVCDESKAVSDFSGVQKISLSPEVLSNWQFERHPDDWGWLCGDYCYYAAAEQLSGFDYFCLIEADVYFNDKGLAEIKAILQGKTSPAIAADLRRFDEPPKFSRDLAQIGEDPHFGCIFPFSRVSAGLISEMFSLRKRVQNHHSPLRVNDEAILSTAAHKMGLGVVDLYEYERVFNKNCFATNPPHLLETVEMRTDDTRVFHPTVPLFKVLDRIRSGEKGFSERRLRRVVQDSSAHVGAAVSRAVERAESVASNRQPQKPVDTNGMERLAFLINLLADFQPIKVVDVGANPIEGDPSYANLLENGQAEVVGIEPNAEAHKELVKSASANESYHCGAVGKGGAAKLHLTRHSGFTSLFQPDEASAEYLGFKRPMQVATVENINTDRLDDLDFIQSIDLLKIDVQGGELDVIGNAKGKLSEAVVIQTEVRFFPLYEDEPTFGDLERELRDQGFLFHSFDFLKPVLGSQYLRRKFKRRAFSQIVDGDAFFVRDLRTLHTFTNKQLSKLCILADSVMGAFDLAGLCLEEFVKRDIISTEDAENYFALLPGRIMR